MPRHGLSGAWWGKGQTVPTRYQPSFCFTVRKTAKARQKIKERHTTRCSHAVIQTTPPKRMISSNSRCLYIPPFFSNGSTLATHAATLGPCSRGQEKSLVAKGSGKSEWKVPQQGKGMFSSLYAPHQLVLRAGKKLLDKLAEHETERLPK